MTENTTADPLALLVTAAADQHGAHRTIQDLNAQLQQQQSALQRINGAVDALNSVVFPGVAMSYAYQENLDQFKDLVDAELAQRSQPPQVDAI